MNKFNKASKLFGSGDLGSKSSVDSVILYRAVVKRPQTDGSTDTEEMIRRVETQVLSCTITVGSRRMTTASIEPGPDTSQPQNIILLSLTKDTLTRKCAVPPRKVGQSPRWSYAGLRFQWRTHSCRQPHTRGDLSGDSSSTISE